jgi:RNA processing factor Prp31
MTNELKELVRAEKAYAKAVKKMGKKSTIANCNDVSIKFAQVQFAKWTYLKAHPYIEMFPID